MDAEMRTGFVRRSNKPREVANDTSAQHDNNGATRAAASYLNRNVTTAHWHCNYAHALVLTIQSSISSLLLRLLCDSPLGSTYRTARAPCARKCCRSARP